MLISPSPLPSVVTDVPVGPSVVGDVPTGLSVVSGVFVDPSEVTDVPVDSSVVFDVPMDPSVVSDVPVDPSVVSDVSVVASVVCDAVVVAELSWPSPDVEVAGSPEAFSRFFTLLDNVPAETAWELGSTFIVTRDELDSPTVFDFKPILAT